MVGFGIVEHIITTPGVFALLENILNLREGEKRENREQDCTV
jgi:hypothetical protein